MPVDDDFRQALGEAFLVNDRVNQLLLESLDAEVWRAKPPGGVRTIAAIFAHMHNIRRKWVRLSPPHHANTARVGDPGSAPQFKLPAELDRARCTQKQTAKALKESAQSCAEMLSDVRVEKFVRDGWAKPWGLENESGAVMMLAYMVSHEAHHRGQVCMLAHQMGYRLPMKVMSKMWAWEGLTVQVHALRAKTKAALRYAQDDNVAG